MLFNRERSTLSSQTHLSAFAWLSCHHGAGCMLECHQMLSESHSFVSVVAAWWKPVIFKKQKKRERVISTIECPRQWPWFKAHVSDQVISECLLAGLEPAWTCFKNCLQSNTFDLLCVTHKPQGHKQMMFHELFVMTVEIFSRGVMNHTLFILF